MLTRSVEQLNNEELLRAFDTGSDPDGRGFDVAMQCRVLAHELVAARGRLDYYRAMYSQFATAGHRYMIENLTDEDKGADGAVPAKLIFTSDVDEVLELQEREAVAVWTEEELLDMLRQQVILHDYFTDLLNELAETEA
jgi:hypothetical protein